MRPERLAPQDEHAHSPLLHLLEKELIRPLRRRRRRQPCEVGDARHVGHEFAPLDSFFAKLDTDRPLGRLVDPRRAPKIAERGQDQQEEEARRKSPQTRRQAPPTQVGGQQQEHESQLTLEEARLDLQAQLSELQQSESRPQRPEGAPRLALRNGAPTEQKRRHDEKSQVAFERRPRPGQQAIQPRPVIDETGAIKAEQGRQQELSRHPPAQHRLEQRDHDGQSRRLHSDPALAGDLAQEQDTEGRGLRPHPIRDPEQQGREPQPVQLPRQGEAGRQQQEQRLRVGLGGKTHRNGAQRESQPDKQRLLPKSQDPRQEIEQKRSPRSAEREQELGCDLGLEPQRNPGRERKAQPRGQRALHAAGEVSFGKAQRLPQILHAVVGRHVHTPSVQQADEQCHPKDERGSSPDLRPGLSGLHTRSRRSPRTTPGC
jgi:hypothetical protein